MICFEFQKFHNLQIFCLLKYGSHHTIISRTFFSRETFCREMNETQKKSLLTHNTSSSGYSPSSFYHLVCFQIILNFFYYYYCLPKDLSFQKYQLQNRRRHYRQLTNFAFPSDLISCFCAALICMRICMSKNLM